MSELVSIVYKPKGSEPTPGAYTRLPLQEAQLIAGYGIENDGKGGSEGRQLNIMAAETMRALADEGFHTAAGQLGEQIVIADLDVNSLPQGARLKIGATACIEVTIPRTGCNRFAAYQGISEHQAAGRLGVMAKVLTGGPIRVGDPVTLLSL